MRLRGGGGIDCNGDLWRKARSEPDQGSDQGPDEGSGGAGGAADEIAERGRSAQGSEQ
ncbi:hypothetical protein [Actinomyces naeslundii]